MQTLVRRTISKHLVTLWISLSLLGVGLSAYTWRQLSIHLEISQQAKQVTGILNEWQRLLLDFETGQRGFTLTGDKVYLDPLLAAKKRLPDLFFQMKNLVRDNPDLLSNVLDLWGDTEVLMAMHQKIIEAREQKGLQSAIAMLRTGESKNKMDVFRKKIRMVMDMRDDIASAAGNRIRQQMLRAELFSFIVGLVGISSGILAFFVVHERQREEIQRQLAEEARLHAERLSHEKSIFLANMSHEIRTPMNAVLGFSELLHSEIKDDRQRSYLTSIRSSANSLLQLINDVLDMSKVEAGVMTMHPEPTDPVELANFVKTVFKENASKKALTLKTEVHDSLPKSLMMDRARMRQILLNLVGNAVKFTYVGSVSMILRGEKNPGENSYRMELIVQDTGVGISSAMKEKIFDPFFQTGQHPELESQGTGLGLGIVKRLVELMNGTIELESAIGKGTTFKVRFPKIMLSSRLPSSDRIKVISECDLNDFQPTRILIVDDQKANLELLKGYLDQTHHQIKQAHDGIEALYLAKSFRPELILMDIRMPRLGGREALAELRKDPDFQLTPVIAVTASLLEADLDSGLLEGFNASLRKPFSRADLYAEMEHFIPKQPQKVSERRDSLQNPESEYKEMDPKDFEIIYKELKVVLDEDLPKIRETMAMKDIQIFAIRLSGIGKRISNKPLQKVIDKLVKQVESYDVLGIEETLESLSTFVRQLETHSRSAS